MAWWWVEWWWSGAVGSAVGCGEGEVFVGVPLHIVHLLELFLGLYVERTPPVVEVVENLKRRDVAIRREPMLQLAVVLFVEGVTEVVDDAA